MLGGLSNDLNNCEGTWDVYRRVLCSTDVQSLTVPTTRPTLKPTRNPSAPSSPKNPLQLPLEEILPPPDVCMVRNQESITFVATDDAYVSAKDKMSNFNNEVILIDDEPEYDGIIRWLLSDDICDCVSIKKVTLRLYVVDPSPSGGFVHVMNPNWDEGIVTWNSAPGSSGPPVTQIGRAYNETWIDIDVTGLVSISNEHVAVRIESCVKNKVQYASKEFGDGRFAPQVRLC